MSEHLKDTVTTFTNDYLVEQFHLNRAQYTDEALSIMEQEIARRGITEEQTNTILAAGRDPADEAVAVIHYDRKDFIPLDGAFTTNDSLLARSMMSEHTIPFFLDSSATHMGFDGNALTSHPVLMFVHNASADAAKALVNEHFDLADNRYTIKYADTKTRLASFNFYEIPQTLLESTDIAAVDFSTEEKNVCIDFCSRLLKEAETVEARIDRMLFYYDNLEDLTERLSSETDPRLTRSDLLTVLEALQCYCAEPNFSGTAMGIAEALLNFFSSTPNS
jgi:hypothetical protein